MLGLCCVRARKCGGPGRSSGCRATAGLSYACPSVASCRTHRCSFLRAWSLKYRLRCRALAFVMVAASSETTCDSTGCRVRRHTDHKGVRFHAPPPRMDAAASEANHAATSIGCAGQWRTCVGTLSARNSYNPSLHSPRLDAAAGASCNVP